MRNAAARSNLLVPEVREVMDIRQASDYLGVSPDTLYKYASDGFVSRLQTRQSVALQTLAPRRVDGSPV